MQAAAFDAWTLGLCRFPVAMDITHRLREAPGPRRRTLAASAASESWNEPYPFDSAFRANLRFGEPVVGVLGDAGRFSSWPSRTARFIRAIGIGILPA